MQLTQALHRGLPIEPATIVTELREHTKRLIGASTALRSFQVTSALPMSSAGQTLKRELRARALRTDAGGRTPASVSGPSPAEREPR